MHPSKLISLVNLQRIGFAGFLLTMAGGGLVQCVGAQQAAAPVRSSNGQTGQQSKAAYIAAAGAAMRDGIAAANRNDLAEARRQFRRAVALAPQVAAAHAALGAVLLAKGELPSAQKELERAHALAPEDVAVTLNLARTESLLAHYSAARLLFDEALRASPALSDEESIAFADALEATGDPARAATLLADAAARSPGSPALDDALGTAYAVSGKLEEARVSFERALTLGRQPQTALHLGAVLLLMGRPEEALPLLREAAAALPENFDVHLQLGRALSALHQDRDALVELHRAAELMPATVSAESTYELALALEASGDAGGSISFFDQAMTAPGLSNEVLINCALAHVQTGDAVGAVPLYARALAVGPDSATLREDYGVAYLQQSDLDDAIVQFRAGLALDAAFAPLHYDLGLALKLKDNLAEAVPELERAAELDPTLPDPAYTLGILYTQQGRMADAAAQMRRVTALQPSNGAAWSALASVLMDSDPAGAADALRKAMVLNPDQPSLHIQLASLLARAGKADEAAAERKVAADLSRAAMSHQRATFALNSGRALLQQGKLPEAITQLTVAAEADPQLADAHALLADALTRQGKAAEAALERQRSDAILRATKNR